MTRMIKLGNLYVEVPDDGSLNEPPIKPASIRAERPPEPEKLDPQPYIYQTNDPFRSSIDRIHALGNLEKVEKPWVRKSFFVLFLVLPFIFGELFAVAAVVNGQGPAAWKVFLFINIFTAVVCTPYFVIWRKASRQKQPVRGA